MSCGGGEVAGEKQSKGHGLCPPLQTGRCEAGLESHRALREQTGSVQLDSGVELVAQKDVQVHTRSPTHSLTSATLPFVVAGGRYECACADPR